jgi:hypothetical protein
MCDCVKSVPSITSNKSECQYLRNKLLDIYDNQKSYYNKNYKLALFENLTKVNSIKSLEMYDFILYKNTEKFMHIECVPTNEFGNRLILIIYVYNPNKQKIGSIQKIFGITKNLTTPVNLSLDSDSNKILKLPFYLKSNCS